jgi:hypothetical protein
MKTRWLLCSVVLLGILGCGGCEDAGAPTEPNAWLNVNGAWTGSMTSYSPACAREGIAVTLFQDGPTVTGNFLTSCQGRLELRGAMSGDSIAGELFGTTDGVRIGQISGTASGASIRITTWGPHLGKMTGHDHGRWST